MVAMQQNIKAKTLKEIAIAIALLAASVLALSSCRSKGLNSGYNCNSAYDGSTSCSYGNYG